MLLRPCRLTMLASVASVAALSITGDYPDAEVGDSYSYTPITTGGVPPYTYAVTTGSLPSGLSIDAGTGEVSGTPDTVEMQSFEVTVTDDVAATDILSDSIDIASAGGDPDFADVRALMHFNGSNGSTTFTDEKGHTFSVVGSGTEISTTQFLDGQSLRLPGNGSYMKSASSETDFGLTTDQYTIEMFLRFDATSGTQFIYDMRGSLGPILAVVSGAWWVFLAGAFRIQTGTLSANTWYHVAIARDASNGTRLFVDGVQVGSTFTDTSNYGSTQPVFFGGPADAPTTFQFAGYVEDYRLTVGTCRYTTTFTPPTPPFLDF